MSDAIVELGSEPVIPAGRSRPTTRRAPACGSATTSSAPARRVLTVVFGTISVVVLYKVFTSSS